jgi:hypothetical protein
MDKLGADITEKIVISCDHRTQSRMGLAGGRMRPIIEQRKIALLEFVKNFHHLGDHAVMSEKKKKLDELCVIGDFGIVKLLEKFAFSNLLNAIISGDVRIVNHVLDAAIENKAVNNDGQRGDMFVKASEYGRWEVFNFLYHHSSMTKYMPNPTVAFRVMLNMGKTHPHIYSIVVLYPKLATANLRPSLMAGAWWAGREERAVFSVPVNAIEHDMLMAGALASKNPAIINQARSIVGPYHRFESGYDVIAASDDAEVVSGFLSQSQHQNIEALQIGHSAINQRKKATVATVIAMFPYMKQFFMAATIKTYGNDEIMRLLYEPQYDKEVMSSRYHYLVNKSC